MTDDMNLSHASGSAYTTVTTLTRGVENDVVDGDATAGHLLQEYFLYIFLLRKDVERQWLLSVHRGAENNKVLIT